MDDVPTPRDLRGAAGVSRTLAYAAGAVGIVAGVVLYRAGETAFAVAVWVLTFGVGALLMIAAFLLLALMGVMARLAAVESDLRVAVGRLPGPGGPGSGGPGHDGGPTTNDGPGDHPNHWSTRRW